MTIAFWCVFVGILLPYLGFGIARNRGRGLDGKRLRDNHNPRDFPNRIEGVAKRAWDAHLNAFEALPAFAAAVIIAHLAQAPQSGVDLLAIVWVMARVGHLGLYLADKSTLRTASRVVGLICVVSLFVLAGTG